MPQLYFISLLFSVITVRLIEDKEREIYENEIPLQVFDVELWRLTAVIRNVYLCVFFMIKIMSLKFCCAIFFLLISFLVRQQSLGDGCACINVCSVNWVWLKLYYGMNYTLVSRFIRNEFFKICLLTIMQCLSAGMCMLVILRKNFFEEVFSPYFSYVGNKFY